MHDASDVVHEMTLDINQFRDAVENVIPPQLDGSSKQSVMDVLVTGFGVIDEVARLYSGHKEQRVTWDVTQPPWKRVLNMGNSNII